MAMVGAIIVGGTTLQHVVGTEETAVYNLVFLVATLVEVMDMTVKILSI